MKQETNLLSVAIPVYNGMPYLAGCLQSIQAHLTAQMQGFLEIIISDNCSTDTTKEVVNVFQKQNPRFVRVLAQTRNLGFDLNLKTLVENSKGKYIWFLGCQEKVAPESINSLMTELETNVDLFLLNFDIYDERTQSTLKSDKSHSMSKTYYSPDDIFHDLPGAFTALSTNVMKREKLLRLLPTIDFTTGSAHIELALATTLQDDFQGLRYLQQEFFTLFREQQGWWARKEVFVTVMTLYTAYEKYASRIPALKKQFANSGPSLIIFLVHSKIRGLRFSSEIKERIKRLFRNYPYYAKMRMIILTPAWIFKPLYNLYTFTRKARRAIIKRLKLILGAKR